MQSGPVHTEWLCLGFLPVLYLYLFFNVQLVLCLLVYLFEDVGFSGTQVRQL